MVVPPKPEWTKIEQWVWEQVREGKQADFNQLENIKLDPAESECCTSTRKLSSNFLETILLDNPFQSALTRKGVRIIGAWFPDSINLENAEIKHEICIDESRLDAGVNLSGCSSTKGSADQPGILSLKT